MRVTSLLILNLSQVTFLLKTENFFGVTPPLPQRFAPGPSTCYQEHDQAQQQNNPRRPDVNPQAQQHLGRINPQEKLNHEATKTVPGHIGPEGLTQLKDPPLAQVDQQEGPQQVPERLVEEGGVKEGTSRVLGREVIGGSRDF